MRQTVSQSYKAISTIPRMSGFVLLCGGNGLVEDRHERLVTGDELRKLKFWQ
jgi:hypothetical protein